MVKTKNISEETITSGSSAIFSFQSNKLLSIVAPDENDIGVITVNVGYLLSDYSIVSSKPSDESTIISSTDNFEIGKEYYFQESKIPKMKK